MPGSSRSISPAPACSHPSVRADHGIEDGVGPALGQRHPRAWGNAARSPLFTPGRPKNRRSPRCRPHPDIVPSIATTRRPASHAPGVSPSPTVPPPGRTTPSPARTPTVHGPGRSPTSTATSPAPAQAPTTPTHRSTTPTHPHRSPPSATPSPPRSTPPPAPATTDAAARSGPPQRSPHRPRQAGNTRVNNPTDTRSDNRRSDSGFTQPARATHPNYTAVVLTERHCINHRLATP